MEISFHQNTRSFQFLRFSIAVGSIVAFIAFMSTPQQTRRSGRFDPSEISDTEMESVQFFLDQLLNEQALPALVDEHDNRLKIPRPIYDILIVVASAMREGQVISLVPERQELTTQAAANLLGMSRPHLIKLLESNALPHHFVGSHRRILMKDVVSFQKDRDAARRTALDDLTRKIHAAGKY